MKNKWFLLEVGKLNKKLFYVFVLILFTIGFTTFTRIEITPFFIWSHYSSQHTPQDKYARSYVRVNEEIIDLVQLPRSTREMIQIPIEQFIYLKEREFMDVPRYIVETKLDGFISSDNIRTLTSKVSNTKEDTKPFMEWLGRYVGSVYELDVRTIELGRFDIRFENGKAIKENYRIIEQLELK